MDFAAIKVHARHEFLENTIGYFDEELQAYRLTMFLAIGFPFILVTGSILQFLLYRLYNRKFHPFKEMAKLKIKGNVINIKSSVSTGCNKSFVTAETKVGIS